MITDTLIKAESLTRYVHMRAMLTDSIPPRLL